MLELILLPFIYAQQFIRFFTDYPELVAENLFLRQQLKVFPDESRRILYVNVTSHPSAQWTLQQFREALPWKREYAWLIHDRDSIYYKQVDTSLESMGLTICRTLPRTPVANSFCERVIGTLRRECLDHVIPLSESHLRRIFGRVGRALLTGEGLTRVSVLACRYPTQFAGIAAA